MAAAGIKVDGLRDVIRSLQRLGVEISDMKAAFKRIGTTVADEARGRINNRTGTLAASIKPSNTKNKSIVRAGSGRVPYAGVIHYGGYNNITANPYLTDALESKAAEVNRQLVEEISGLIRKVDLT